MKPLTSLKLLGISFISGLFFLFSPLLVQAQQTSLNLSPSLSQLVIQPGRTADDTFQLTNAGDPTTVRLNVFTFVPRDQVGHITIENKLEGGIEFLINHESELKLNEPFFLKTNEKKQFKLSIHPPEGTPQRDYYYILLAQSEPVPSEEGTSTLRAKITVGSPLLITVSHSGQVQVKPKVILFRVIAKYRFFGQNIFDSFDKIPLVLTVGNEGENFVLAQGKIILKTQSGKIVNFLLKPQKILAQSQRLLKADPSPYEENLSLLLSGFFIGKYQTSATITFGDGAANLVASTNFLAVPFKLIMFLLLAAALFVFLVLKYLRKKNQ